MGMPAASRRRWTPEQVRQLMAKSESHWPRYELIDGELIVSPSPKMPHNRALQWLFLRLHAYASREGIGAVAFAPADLELRPGTISQPDVFVAPADQVRRLTNWQDVTGVCLVVEIVSPGSARIDRGVKRKHYQRSRIPEYWIVDVQQRFIERWRPDDAHPETLRDRLVWHPPGAARLELDLTELWNEATPPDAR